MKNQIKKLEHVLYSQGFELSKNDSNHKSDEIVSFSRKDGRWIYVLNTKNQLLFYTNSDNLASDLCVNIRLAVRGWSYFDLYKRTSDYVKM